MFFEGSFSVKKECSAENAMGHACSINSVCEKSGNFSLSEIFKTICEN